jgi:hypothetical protein
LQAYDPVVAFKDRFHRFTLALIKCDSLRIRYLPDCPTAFLWLKNRVLRISAGKYLLDVASFHRHSPRSGQLLHRSVSNQPNEIAAIDSFIQLANHGVKGREAQISPEGVHHYPALIYNRFTLTSVLSRERYCCLRTSSDLFVTEA